MNKVALNQTNQEIRYIKERKKELNDRLNVLKELKVKHKSEPFGWKIGQKVFITIGNEVKAVKILGFNINEYTNNRFVFDTKEFDDEYIHLEAESKEVSRRKVSSTKAGALEVLEDREKRININFKTLKKDLSKVRASIRKLKPTKKGGK